jgi:hypothetical protein
MSHAVTRHCDRRGWESCRGPGRWASSGMLIVRNPKPPFVRGTSPSRLARPPLSIFRYVAALTREWPGSPAAGFGRPPSVTLCRMNRFTPSRFLMRSAYLRHNRNRLERTALITPPSPSSPSPASPAPFPSPACAPAPARARTGTSTHAHAHIHTQPSVTLWRMERLTPSRFLMCSAYLQQC